MLELGDEITITSKMWRATAIIADLVDLREPTHPDLMDFPIIWQWDPRWSGEFLGDLGRGRTIGEAGCAVACLTAWLQWTCGWEGDLLETRGVLHRRGLLCGSDHTLVTWASLETAWHAASFDARCWASWRSSPADLEMLDHWLKNGPVVVEVDFVPETMQHDQHFVVALCWADCSVPLKDRTLTIMDPWEGSIRLLPPAYYDDHWNGGNVTRLHGKVARILTGARAIGHAGEL